MNVLIASAGRRGYLVEYFRDALAGSGLVVAADASADAPALADADIPVTVPPFLDARYPWAIADIVREHDVRLLLTVNDYDARVLAGHSAVLRRAGCLPMLPSERVVALVTDKLRLTRWCAQHGLPVPRIAAAGEPDATSLQDVGGRAVVKPRFGSASRAIFVVEDAHELAAAVTLSARASVDALGRPVDAARRWVLVQEHVAGDEYGMDVVNDHRGRHVAVLLRRKLQMRGGETDRAITVRDPRLESFGRRLGELLGHVGCLDCDVVVRDGEPHLLDANPRFGGGYPFVHAAGADLPRAYLSWASGAPAPEECFTYDPGIVSSKTVRLVVSRRPSPVP